VFFRLVLAGVIVTVAEEAGLTVGILARTRSPPSRVRRRMSSRMRRRRTLFPLPLR
jgi:hypothetical protein